MQSRYHLFKNKAILLRKSGKTYGEIKKMIKQPIPKSTLSTWFFGLTMSLSQKENIQKRIRKNIFNGQRAAVEANRTRRREYIRAVEKRVRHLGKKIKNKDIAKIAITMLYLGEGTKSHGGSLIFGNSDPKIIGLFLKLLRYCYNIDENKFRCTLQCRADQDIKKLEKFWSKTTEISLKQFYNARIDPRTIGKPSKKPDYKGVCRIDYFSADVYNELMKIGEIVCNAGR